MKKEKITKKEEKTEVETKREQAKNEKKILKTIMLVLGMITLAFVAYLVFSYFAANFEYQGVKFTAVSDEWIGVLYNTKIPVTYEGTNYDYNFYMRKDPRSTVKNVPFEGEMEFREFMVLNSTGEINCGGDGVIAIANLKKLFEVAGTKVGTDANSSCDSLGRYIYVNVEISDETKIIETSPACYAVYVSNCEILEATERFMIEAFVELKNQE